MALTKCKECGSMVSSAASACPHCGKPASKQTSLLTYAIGGTFAAIIISWISGTENPSRVDKEPAKLTEEQLIEKARSEKAGTALFNAEYIVKANLKDSESAKFGNSYFREPNYVCGFVNSKNSFGGYTGDIGYIVDFESKKVIFQGLHKEFSSRWSKICS